MGERPRTQDWRLDVPPVLWPVPVMDACELLPDKTSLADLIGHRVVLGDPVAGLYFYDVRLVIAPHMHQGAQVVGVVPEIDWYRRERDDTAAVVPTPVPVTRVWYEVGKYMEPTDQPIPLSQDDVQPARRSAHLVPRVDEPPVRWPRNCAEMIGVTGARCWLGARPNFRIASEPVKQQDPSGVDLTQGLDGLDKPVVAPVVRVLREADWYRQLDTGADRSRNLEIWHAEASLVWLE